MTTHRVNGRPVIAAILDEFTTACLRPDATLIGFRPDNWRTTLEATAPDLLLVESAWRGNGGAWQYKISSSPGNGDDLAELVQYCQRRSIPTVFWNKEDPPHFTRFITRAALFDYIFTSDSDCIPRYQDVVKHDRVFPLPFAAQPAIHHPIVDHARQHDVCFAGTYDRVKYDERRQDLEMILRPALDFGLHIYDRNYGLTGPTYDKLRFPDRYQPTIKGRLQYDQMVEAYKAYKVFLNVNSVKTSPTMFSRRVFELLACGTAVVSTYARGIEELLGRGVVCMVDSEDETRKQLERLLQDEDAWRRVSVRGIRRVLDRHTYAHRLAYVRQQLGLEAGLAAGPSVSILARARNARELARLEETLAAQTYRRAQVALVLGASGLESAVTTFRNALADLSVTVLPAAATGADVECALTGEFVWTPHASDFYGPEFLRDCMLATAYASADIISKTTHFRTGKNATVDVRNAGHEFRRGSQVTKGARIIRRAALKTADVDALLAGRKLKSAGLPTVAIDRFNYLRDAYAPGSLTPLVDRRALRALVV